MKYVGPRHLKHGVWPYGQWSELRTKRYWVRILVETKTFSDFFSFVQSLVDRVSRYPVELVEVCVSWPKHHESFFSDQDFVLNIKILAWRSINVGNIDWFLPPKMSSWPTNFKGQLLNHNEKNNFFYWQNLCVLKLLLLFKNLL